MPRLRPQLQCIVPRRRLRLCPNSFCTACSAQTFRSTSPLSTGRSCAAERKFVFIRASYGDELDPSFSVNWKAARDHGIPRGAYHFFNPQKSLRLQIRQFIQAVGKLEKGDLPPIIDLEDYKHNKLWPSAQGA